MTILYLTIFFTGAVTLSLEVLASRILTPYFGVSLYIWSGILSITLLSLAFGYFAGGRLCTYVGRQHKQGSPKHRYTSLFFLLPAISGLCIGLAALVYPFCFVDLAQFHLIAGAYIANLMLLAAPLVCLSAMNPLLIAIGRMDRRDESREGDAGAGFVYFTGTLGSVAGVLATTFLLIPRLSNYASITVLGLLLAALPVLRYFTGSKRHGTLSKAALFAGLAGLLLCAALLLSKGWLLNRSSSMVFEGRQWEILREYPSFFGTIQVVRQDSSHMYIINGSAQDGISADGQSVYVFTHMLESLAMGLAQNPRNALVLGLAAGIVPMRLAERDIKVDVVEINPRAVEAATDHFGFRQESINVIINDARTYMRECTRRYDIIIMDLFHGDEIPEYLVSREMFSNISTCMQPEGVLVLNMFEDPAASFGEYSVLKTVQQVFQSSFLFGDPNGQLGNIFLVAGNQLRLQGARIHIDNAPKPFQPLMHRMLERPLSIDQQLLEKAPVLTDNYNIYSVLNASLYQETRALNLQHIPPLFLTN